MMSEELRSVSNGMPSNTSQLRWLQRASIAEGFTLLALVFVAVPAKHVFGLPELVRILGPVHGLAFIIYVWLLIRVKSSGEWPDLRFATSLLLACIPFGGFINEASLRRLKISGQV